MSELVAGKIAGSDIGGQARLNQLQISYVSAVRAIPLVADRDIVVP
ncbi:MAG TPA: hypothetical protein VKP67_12320 [Xanthobacteraceae bacterium]|nr:hypothetical protein [Xanthobacteraceae bacterium]